MYHNSINAASEASGVMNVVNVVYSYSRRTRSDSDEWIV